MDEIPVETGYPEIDATLAGFARGMVCISPDFQMLKAVKNDARRVAHAAALLAGEGLPAARVADCFAKFAEAVREGAEAASSAALEMERRRDNERR